MSRFHVRTVAAGGSGRKDTAPEVIYARRAGDARGAGDGQIRRVRAQPRPFGAPIKVSPMAN